MSKTEFRYILFVIAVLLLICARGAFGQCSTTNPCVPVKVTQQPFSSGSTYTPFSCMGAASQCSSTALNQHISAPTSSDVWRTLGTFPQASSTAVYNDSEPYGALMNYAALNTSSGGAAGPVSGIVIFQVPTQATAPSLAVGPSIVTTGAPGPQ